MKITPIFLVGRSLIYIGYKYNFRKVLGFITTEGGGITEPGDTYLSHFPYMYSNVSVPPVIFPHLIVRYFNDYNEMSKYDMAVCSSAREIVGDT